MMPDDFEENQLFYKTGDGEYKPLAKGSLQMEEISDTSDENITRCFPAELRFKMKKKEIRKLMQALEPKYISNNWRKMHGLPLIRRRGK